jgi:DNA-binding response OmpR family regulator
MTTPAFNETEYLRARVAELERLVGSIDAVKHLSLQRAFGLTPMQATLLFALYDTKARVSTKRDLLHRLHPGGSKPDIKIIDVFVCLIRGNLRDAGEPEFIDTIWGQGYRLTPEGIARISELIGERG